MKSKMKYIQLFNISWPGLETTDIFVCILVDVGAILGDGAKIAEKVPKSIPKPEKIDLKKQDVQNSIF